MGVPRVPDGRYMAPCHGRGGLREEKVHLAILREYYWSLPSRKAAKENWLFLGVLFGGSDGCPQGPRWPIHGPLPWARWVERRKGAFGSFERELLVLTLSESG